MTIALICGGRNYGRVPFGTPRDQYREAAAKASKEIFVLREALDHLRIERGITEIVNGGQSGADQHAHAWAEFHCIPSEQFKAQWKVYGRAAGPIRNGVMLAKRKPDFVVAFDGGDGTADMVRQAIAACVEVIDLRQKENEMKWHNADIPKNEFGQPAFKGLIRLTNDKSEKIAGVVWAASDGPFHAQAAPTVGGTIRPIGSFATLEIAKQACLDFVGGKT